MPALVLLAFLLLFSLLSLFLEQVPGGQLLLIPVFKHLCAQLSAFKTWAPLRQKSPWNPWDQILKSFYLEFREEQGIWGCWRESAFWNLHPVAGWTWVPDELCEGIKDMSKMNKTAFTVQCSLSAVPQWLVPHSWAKSEPNLIPSKGHTKIHKRHFQVQEKLQNSVTESWLFIYPDLYLW